MATCISSIRCCSISAGPFETKSKLCMMRDQRGYNASDASPIYDLADVSQHLARIQFAMFLTIISTIPPPFAQVNELCRQEQGRNIYSGHVVLYVHPYSSEILL